LKVINDVSKGKSVYEKLPETFKKYSPEGKKLIKLEKLGKFLLIK
jgi:hypothetical protein